MKDEALDIRIYYDLYRILSSQVLTLITWKPVSIRYHKGCTGLIIRVYVSAQCLAVLLANPHQILFMGVKNYFHTPLLSLTLNTKYVCLSDTKKHWSLLFLFVEPRYFLLIDTIRNPTTGNIRRIRFLFQVLS